LREGFVRDEKWTRRDVFGKGTTPETPTEVRGEKLPQRGIFGKRRYQRLNYVGFMAMLFQSFNI